MKHTYYMIDVLHKDGRKEHVATQYKNRGTAREVIKAILKDNAYSAGIREYQIIKYEVTTKIRKVSTFVVG